MSELVSVRKKSTIVTCQLLTTVSALVLTAYTASTSVVDAEEDSRPTVWIDLGGQIEMLRGLSSAFTAPFMTTQADSPVFSPVSPEQSQKSPRFSLGEEGEISLQPAHSIWVFSAALRYGRSGYKRAIHQQTNGLPIPSTSLSYQIGQHSAYKVQSYEHITSRLSESHTVLDFKVGKDVGLGLFGPNGVSVLGAGIRMARFSSDASADIRARPDVSVSGFSPYSFKYNHNWHNYHLTGHSERSFHGVGPSAFWNGSASIIGSRGDGQLAVDWGVDAALLFGRQKAKIHHSTTANVFHNKYGYLYAPRDGHSTRSRSVVVPNVGGFASLSYQFQAAKLNVGYRADLYVDAMDTGIDARQSSNVLFHGPYATISIGLGG